ncbi:hypothetical protein L9F63_021157, partial [Diploptera punctata]
LSIIIYILRYFMFLRRNCYPITLFYFLFNLMSLFSGFRFFSFSSNLYVRIAHVFCTRFLCYSDFLMDFCLCIN